MICGSRLRDQAIDISRGQSTGVSLAIEPSTCKRTTAAVVFQKFRFCLWCQTEDVEIPVRTVVAYRRSWASFTAIT